MEKQKALNRDIKIYWWNFNKKQLDFSGTYKEWFEKNKIKITVIKNHIYF